MLVLIADAKIACLPYENHTPMITYLSCQQEAREEYGQRLHSKVPLNFLVSEISFQ